MRSKLYCRSAFLACVLGCVVALQGCQHSTSVEGAGPSLLTGNVHGGQQPVSGAQVRLYAANATAVDGAATLLASAATSPDGTFVLPAYTCPAPGASTYLVAVGGNPGLGGTVNNAALALMAALGPCSALSASTIIQVNELTTVAAAGVLAPYMTSYANLGATSQATLTSLFSTVNEYVNFASGTVPGTTLPYGYSASQSVIATVADILAPCVNSSGTDSNCNSLFALLGSPVPTDTIGAAIYLFNHPTINTTPLFNLINASAPFQPALSSAPSTFALSIVAKLTSYVSIYGTPSSSTPPATFALGAMVSPSTATGTVTFLNGATVIGTANVVNGTATFTTPSYPAGSYSFYATYSGDNTYLGATLPFPYSYSLNKIATTTSTPPSGQYIVVGQTVSISAHVTPATATGSVFFSPNGATVPLVGGNATTTFPWLSSYGLGLVYVGGSYSGDANYAASSDPGEPVTVVYQGNLTISPGTGTYTAPVSVNFLTFNSSVYYTTDGSNPMTSSTATQYKGSLVISHTTTVNAYSPASGLYTATPVVSAVYTFQ